MPKPSTTTKKPGEYLELRAQDIDGGSLMAELHNHLRRAATELETHEKKTGSTKGKAKVTLEITLTRHQNSSEFLDLDYELGLKTPRQRKSAMVRAGQGRLLFEPDGQSLNDADQPRLFETFDRFGNPKATIDRETGEVIEVSATAGKIGAA